MEQFLALLAGTLLSLAASYLPGFSTWYAALDRTRKSGVMLALLALGALAVFGLSCARLNLPTIPSVACDQNGAVEVVSAFLLALSANQATYVITRANVRASDKPL